MTRCLLLTSALLIASCGPKSLTLPEQPMDRAATCGVVAVAEGRLGTADIKAPLPFDAMGRVLHYPLLAGSTGDSFSSEAAADVQKRMTDLQDSVTEGKWQELIPACRAAFPATAVSEVKLPPDRLDAQLGCYELGDFMRSALEEQGKYDNELGEYRQLDYKLDASPQDDPGYREQLAGYRAAVAALAPGEMVRAGFITARGQLIELPA